MGVSALVAVQLEGPAQADAEARLLLHLILHNYATHKHPDLTKLKCDRSASGHGEAPLGWRVIAVRGTRRLQLLSLPSVGL